MDLADVHSELVVEAQQSLGVVIANDAVGRIGYVFDDLSTYFQGLGICHLLEFADTEQFRENLVRSGHARRYFLRKSREQGNTDDRHLALSRTEAFLDAVVAVDLALARDIARLSIDRWEPAWEYEDDYCYYRFLHTIVLAPDEAPTEALDALLDRFEGVLEGGTSARLDACKALLHQDEVAFDDALEMLMEETQQAHDEKRELVETYDFPFWPRSFVSIEGLALLKVADLLGVPARDAFPLCPNLGRLASPGRPVFDLFAEIERRG